MLWWILGGIALFLVITMIAAASGSSDASGKQSGAASSGVGNLAALFNNMDAKGAEKFAQRLNQASADDAKNLAKQLNTASLAEVKQMADALNTGADITPIPAPASKNPVPQTSPPHGATAQEARESAQSEEKSSPTQGSILGSMAPSLVQGATSTGTLEPGQFRVVVVETLWSGSMAVKTHSALGADTPNVLHLAVMCFDEGGNEVLRGEDKDDKWWNLNDVKQPAVLYVPRETLPYLQQQPRLWKRVQQ